MSDEYDGNEMECSYCGAWIYADAPRCPKCGNYTDNLGPRARPESPWNEKKPLPRVFVIAGWLVVLAFVLPVVLSVINWFMRGR